MPTALAAPSFAAAMARCRRRCRQHPVARSHIPLEQRQRGAGAAVLTAAEAGIEHDRRSVARRQLDPGRHHRQPPEVTRAEPIAPPRRPVDCLERTP
jgi:hypothetical protein